LTERGVQTTDLQGSAKPRHTVPETDRGSSLESLSSSGQMSIPWRKPLWPGDLRICMYGTWKLSVLLSERTLWARRFNCQDHRNVDIFSSSSLTLSTLHVSSTLHTSALRRVIPHLLQLRAISCMADSSNPGLHDSSSFPPTPHMRCVSRFSSWSSFHSSRPSSERACRSDSDNDEEDDDNSPDCTNPM